MQQALGFGLVLFKIGLFLLRLGPSHRREGFQVLAMPCTDVASTCLMLATPFILYASYCDHPVQTESSTFWSQSVAW